MPEEDPADEQNDFATGRRFRQSLLCHSEARPLTRPNPQLLRHCFAGGPMVPSPDIGEQRFLEAAAIQFPEYLSTEGWGEIPARLFLRGMIDVRTSNPRVEKDASPGSKRPLASPLARLQAESGRSVTNLLHMEVQLASDSIRAVLVLADGTRTEAAMVRDLGKLYPAETKAALTNAVRTHLDDLRAYGLILRVD